MYKTMSSKNTTLFQQKLTPQNQEHFDINCLMDDFRRTRSTEFDLRKIDFDPTNDFTYDEDGCITRYTLDDPIIKNNIHYITDAISYLEGIMSEEQTFIYRSIIQNVKDTTMYDSSPGYWKLPNAKKAEHSIINAPAGTGKSLILLCLAMKFNMIMGRTNGALIFSPSWVVIQFMTNLMRFLRTKI